MRVSKIHIRNIIGIQALDIKPGSVTRIEGKNGAGKSSIITALRAIVKGGKQVEIVRDNKPADEPSEIGLLIEDEGGQIAILKRITPSGSTPVVKVAGATQKEPQRIIDSILDSLAANPLDFLKAKPAEQVQWLLSAMPFEVTAEQFLANGINTEGWSIPAGQHGLVTMDQVHQFLYDSRRDANVEARKAGETAERLRESLPEGTGEEIVAEQNRLRSERDSLNGDIASYREKIKSSEAAAIAEIRETSQALLDAKQREVMEARALVQKLESEWKAIEAQRNADIRGVQETAAAPQKHAAKLLADLAAVDQQIAVVDQKWQSFQRAAGLRDEYQRTSKAATDAKEASASFDAMLNRLAAMKKEVLSKIPIKGVEIKGDQIFYKGHALSTQNMAQQAILALKVCVERLNGKVRLICLDGAEFLDPETYAAIDDFAEANDVQFIITRVTGDETLMVDKVPMKVVTPA